MKFTLSPALLGFMLTVTAAHAESTIWIEYVVPKPVRWLRFQQISFLKTAVGLKKDTGNAS